MFANPFDPVVEPFPSCRILPVTISAHENKMRFLPHALACVLVVACFISVGESALAAASEGVAPRQLLCESMENPLGIDIAHPLLSWQLQDTRRGARQTAYQIRVASSAAALAGGDVWDSGLVNSAQSVNVAYAGPALESRRRYYWQVRVWDQQGQASAYSEASWWEMGLLDAQDWRAKWITRDLPVERGDYESGVRWIWDAKDNGLSAASPGKHEFRFRLVLQERPQEGILFVTGKDNVAAWVNGKQVLEAEPVMRYGPRHPWGYFRVIAVSQLLTKGSNELAAEVVVDKTRGGDLHPAGLIAMLRLRMPDGKIQRFCTGPDWKAAAEQSGTDWVTETFDDSSWSPAAAIADVGQGPFGTPWPALPASLLRRKFTLAKPIRSAQIYSTALGSYQLFVNGRRVGNDVLAPGWTDYRKRIVYQVYDVTSQVKQGSNAIGAILGGGWYADALTWHQTRYNFGPPPVRLLVQLEVEYTDGTRDSVVTDESWRTTQSPILHAEIYNGEVYDARLEPTGWDQPSFSDARWSAAAVESAPQAALVAQDFQPIRVEQSLKPKTMTTPAPGVYIFDLGQNMVGWERLHVSGRAGTKVQLRFGEVLQSNGQLYTDNLRTAEATDIYTLRGQGNEVFEPHFTFHGFRYIEITGYPGTPSNDAVEGVVFHTDAPFTIQFQTASAMVNQLWSNILWGQRGNFLSVPTDCPQRDERLGWMGDAEVFWRTATFDANLAAFSHKFTADIRDAQVASGGFTDVSPMVGDVSNSVAGWADAGVVIPWTAYVQYGDTRILDENWAAMEKWMDHLESSNPNHLWLKERGNDYGDWLAIGSVTSKDLIATAFWAYDASLMTRIAQVLDRPSDVEKYAKLFDQVRSAFDQQYVKPDGTVGNGSQTSYVLALHMQLLPASLRAAASQKLADDIKAHDWHLTTGFLGTPYLMLELSNSGHSDIAYRLLLQTTYPSWGYMIEHGATTMWERWNGDQMMGDPSMNSFNHYAYGAVAEWLYRYAAGIDEDAGEPAFHRVILHPQFDPNLKEAKATYDSAFGPIGSSWKDDGSTVTWIVAIPPNTTGLLYFPADATTRILEDGRDISQSVGISLVAHENGKAVYEAGSGSYLFTVQY
jgi:alpha-L-rhamnosidase